jgi:hypothetical protein
MERDDRGFQETPTVRRSSSSWEPVAEQGRVDVIESSADPSEA